MEPLKLGLIGLGGMGRGHLDKESNSPLIKFVGVADVSRAAVDQIVNIPGYYDPLELINSGTCEAVLIATPHPVHAPIARAAMRRGLH
ncbi:MAG TPA: Gfo/Idh/MocA family oxidoreductase, partial [Chloroflexota bacterium]|nr:Gfo/Idh/MocA family oxidoreductase [Chloroflexota bacterium]